MDSLAVSLKEYLVLQNEDIVDSYINVLFRKEGRKIHARVYFNNGVLMHQGMSPFKSDPLNWDVWVDGRSAICMIFSLYGCKIPSSSSIIPMNNNGEKDYTGMDAIASKMLTEPSRIYGSVWDDTSAESGMTASIALAIEEPESLDKSRLKIHVLGPNCETKKFFVSLSGATYETNGDEVNLGFFQYRGSAAESEISSESD